MHASTMNGAPAATGDPIGVHPLDAIRMVRSAGGALAVQALLHAQLAGIEWQQEQHRLLRMLVMTLLGFACLLCAMLFAGGLVLAFAWESAYRIATVAGLLVCYSLGTAAAWRRFQIWSALGGQIFTASLEELAADAALFKGRA
jgi:uncharacterized membrane protein YqjE